MRAIIVDDEYLLLKELEKMLMDYPMIEVIGAYTDPALAYEEFQIKKPEVAFLDIEMAGMNGIELAEKIISKNPSTDIFFVTAYNHYATEAFEANALDYLLKPVRPERLFKAIQKLTIPKSISSEPVNHNIRITSFGKFGVYVDDIPLKWSRAKQQELFAYLLQYEGKWIDKYRICDELWGELEPAQGLANLQTAIWAIRKLLKEKKIEGIHIEFFNDSYILYLKNADWDVLQFNLAHKYCMNKQYDEKIFMEAIKLYGEGYLFCVDWNWTAIERGSYVRKYQELIRYYKNKNR